MRVRRGAVLGVDLAQRVDFTAHCLVVPDKPTEDEPHRRWYVPHVEQVPKGTPYAEIANDVAELAAEARKFGEVKVACDVTGVGGAVAEMITAAIKPLDGVDLVSITITGGRKVTGTRTAPGVPKLDMVSAGQVALENKHLRFAAGEHVDILKSELENFVVKASTIAAGEASYEADRQGHDDTVIAMCAALWLANRDLVPQRMRTSSAARLYVAPDDSPAPLGHHGILGDPGRPSHLPPPRYGRA